MTSHLMDMVRIHSFGVSPGAGVSITDAGGEQIPGIESVLISIKPNDVVRAHLQICAIDLMTEAVPTFQIVHPKTGDLREVKRIEFANGEALDF